MIRIDFSNLMNKSIGENGLLEDDFKNIDIAGLIDAFDSRKYDEMQFLDLLHSDTEDIKNMGEYASRFDNFLLLGIGGSALGPRAIVESLSPFHNYKQKPRVFIYDNVDPMTITGILDVIDLKKTIINVISKSGSTAETIASFMMIWKRLSDMALKPENHIILTTDPKKGNLRKIVNDYGLKSLSIPSGVGGRYSVLSAVGLLIAETIGTDSNAMLNGARDMHHSCMQRDIWKNPAGFFASGLYLMQKTKNRNINVLMPYADRLKPFSEWFCQLWAESLGKDGKGLTPYPSIGTVDQHSQLQLWMQGPEDKVVVFIAIEDYGVDIEIPSVFQNMEGLGYLSGHSLAELIKIEQEASEIALTKNKRPSITVKAPKIDAYYLGQLFHFFEISTAMAGLLYNVNPFDQPGVEEGKNLTYGMMGKKGYEAKKEEFNKYRQRQNLLIL